MDNKGASLTTQCMEFCQVLASQRQAFSFALTTGSAFTFSLDNREKITTNKVNMKKKPSPSTSIRSQKRREEFFKENSESAELASRKEESREKEMVVRESDIKEKEKSIKSREESIMEKEKTIKEEDEKKRKLQEKGEREMVVREREMRKREDSVAKREELLKESKNNQMEPIVLKNPSASWQCNQCDQAYSTAIYLNTHINNTHNRRIRR
jgi:hypothetical protein